MDSYINDSQVICDNQEIKEPAMLLPRQSSAYSQVYQLQFYYLIMY